MTYLHRRPNNPNYYFRRAVPEELQAAVAVLKGRVAPVTEIKESLGTPDAKKAKHLAHLKALEVEALFRQAAAQSGVEIRDELSDLEISKLVDLWKHDVLEEDEDSRRDGDNLDAPAAGLTDREFRKKGEAIEIVGHGLRENLARGRTDLVEFEVVDLLERNGLHLPKEGPSFRKLAFALLKANVEVNALQAKRQVGEVVDTPPAPVMSRAAPAPSGGRTTLQKVFERWDAERKPAAKTTLEFGTAVRRFEELHGSMEVAKITRHMVVAYKDALLQVLARPTHAHRKLPLPAQIEAAQKLPDQPRLSAASVQKQLNAIKALLQWALDNALVDANASSRVTVRNPDKEDIPRLSYDLDDLRAIAAFPIYQRKERPEGGKGEAAYWIPILCLYTGARQTEVGQLLVTDVRQEGDVWFLDIRARATGEIQQKVKKKASNRRVPLHSEIVRLGFLDYLKVRKSAGGLMLFPDLKAREGTKQLMASWSSWWGRYAREHGVPDRDKSFHSFRHSFKDACRRAAIEEATHDALTGHSGGGTGRRYGSAGTPVEVLAQAVERISFPGVAFPRWST